MGKKTGSCVRRKNKLEYVEEISGSKRASERKRKTKEDEREVRSESHTKFSNVPGIRLNIRKYVRYDIYIYKY